MAKFFRDDTKSQYPKPDNHMNLPAASSGVSKTKTGRSIRRKRQGIYPKRNKFVGNECRRYVQLINPPSSPFFKGGFFHLF